MKKSRYIFFNILPIFIIMAIIFTASSQSSDQQDISPVVDRITDRGFLKDSIIWVMDKADRVVERGAAAAAARPYLALGAAAILGLLTAAVFFRLFRSTDSRVKKGLKSLIYTGILFAFALAVLALLKSDAIVEVIRNHTSYNQLVSLLNRIEFTYAGTVVSIEARGVESFLTFLIRKTAHFTLFGLLGFFLFLAIHRLNGRTLVTFVLAMLFVVAYAALDEYRQTFIPSRSGLVEDVILDSAGGVFGTSMAWLKVKISQWWERT
ncbi:VanZ family protein [Bacillus sp. H-16]|uniref:VanZ family protein n=1 Tax=Alteribacter salitolerans TaxID=2912333 RepID=UPI0019652AA1|nr:VanZ family protein [Alteribacter salitolerans]MBM7095790.1 VanZ family protein [Alteribacter salitolerans]